MSKLLHLDPFAGIAGDMFLGAMIDLGAPLAGIAAALRPLTVKPNYRITAEPTTRHGIAAVDLKVHVADEPHHHHHTTYRDVVQMIDALDAAPRARDRAAAIVRRLGEAEAEVHGVELDPVHFHEVGAVDSIVDMLGSAVALELLDVETITCAPLPLGHGFIECAHGTLPLPAPATAAILRDIPTYDVDREGETVTPTGAAIVAALASQFGPQPPMHVTAVGHGAGDRDDPDTPNLLRALLGQPIATTDA